MARLARYTFYFPATSLDINGRQQQTRFFFRGGSYCSLAALDAQLLLLD